MTSTSAARDQDVSGVTVIIAAYNCENFVHHAITSALQQEGVELEVIVIDDASTDGTARCVDALAQRDGRLRLIRLPTNGGPARARNRGIVEASYEWIAVLDADDAFKPGRLKQLTNIADETGADILADNFVSRNVATGRISAPAVRRMSGRQRLDLYTFLEAARPFANDVDLGLLKPVFRKSFLDRFDVHYPVDVRHGEDFEMVLSALARGAEYILDTSVAFYVYTERSSGWSRTPINYSGQIARSRFLASEDPYRSDPRSVKLLGERASALARLEAQHRELQLYRSSGFFERLRIDLSSPAGWRRLAIICRDHLLIGLGALRFGRRRQ